MMGSNLQFDEEILSPIWYSCLDGLQVKRTHHFSFSDGFQSAQVQISEEIFGTRIFLRGVLGSTGCQPVVAGSPAGNIFDHAIPR
jgi:hypothetical protein